ncbi:zf-HC2 domain-containing protein [Streptosporangium sp. NPDC048865]|uniref:zf-HC2 domain-containing protein n=1 Tax=Streptosporangium sp. NPDC048865 TaxID=3155766 RepID=UPI00342C6EE4
MVTVVKRFSCEEAVELVTAFLEGELGEPARHRFEEHLSGCEGCERYLDQVRATVEALGRLRAAGALGTPGSTDAADAPRAAPGPPWPEGLPKRVRDRLLAAFRAGRPT